MKCTHVNGDHSQDLLITGQNSSNDYIAKLYINDGEGFFTEMTNTPFEGLASGSIDFADVDGDNDQDVLITGRNNDFVPMASLYTNEGEGNFTKMMDSPFEGVWSSSVAFADVNGDDHLDVLIAGSYESSPKTSQLYINDGLGNYTKKTDVAIDNVTIGTIAIADVNNDDHQYVFITGFNSFGCRVSKLYINDGPVSSATDFNIGLKSDFNLFPNPPMSNEINISFDSPEKGFVIVQVYDLNGILLSEQKEFVFVGKQIISINIAFLTSGTYFIQLNDGKSSRARKLVMK